LFLFTRVLCMRMHPKQQGIQLLRLNRSSKLRSLVKQLVLSKTIRHSVGTLERCLEREAPTSL